MRSLKKKYLVICIAALFLIGAVSVSAYLFASNGPVKNEFTAATEPSISITESTDNPLTLKENVAVDVGNPGYAVYVRAAIVVNWVDEYGNVYSIKPVLGQDYEMSLNTEPGGSWLYNGNDGYYYHKDFVVAGQTGVLIASCYQTAVAPTGYSLSVEIIAQTIQAVGTTDKDEYGNEVEVGIPAVTDAWGVYVVDGSLSLSPALDP